MFSQLSKDLDDSGTVNGHIGHKTEHLGSSPAVHSETSFPKSIVGDYDGGFYVLCHLAMLLYSVLRPPQILGKWHSLAFCGSPFMMSRKLFQSDPGLGRYLVGSQWLIGVNYWLLLMTAAFLHVFSRSHHIGFES